MSNNFTGKNIIITGCCGQIGSKLCEELSKLDFNVYGIEMHTTVQN